MRLVVLPQKFHYGEVHSVDVNQTNSLVATGGRDHNVSVWKLHHFTDLVSDGPPKLNTIVPEKTIDVHTSTVKLVCWSPTNDHQLMSADENGHLVKTDLHHDTSVVIFPPPYLQNHPVSTAIDGCWSNDGRLFVWSTADGAVHIYDAVKETHQFLISHSEKTGDKKVTIQRSIAFDPTNRHLVCLGDDTMVTVFQYEYDKNNNYRFQVASRISRLMNNSVTKSSGIKYRRISWSCDGEFFAVPNATKQSTSVVSLLSASMGWDNNISLVGHDMECDLVKFAPHIFESRGENSNSSSESDLEILDYEVYHIIATAGSDNSLVLWNTSKESPLFVMHDVSSKPLVDLVWDKTGKFILMTTLEGQIIIGGFSKGELGECASSDFLQKFKATQKQAKKQSSAKTTGESSTSRKSKAPIESISQNDAVDIRDEGDISDANDTFVSADQSTSSSPTQSKVSHLGEITPEVLAPGLDFNSNIESTFMSAIDERTASRATSMLSSAPKKTEPQGEIQSSAKPPSNSSPKVTIKNGKKRIQPTPLSNGNDMQNTGYHNPNTQSKTLPPNCQAGMEFDKPSYVISEDLVKDTKRPKSSDEGPLKKKAKRELEPVKFLGSVVINPSTTFAQVRLSAPKIRSGFRIPDTPYTLDIKNGQGNESAPSRVTCLKEESQIWTDFIPQFIQLATKGNSFWALSTAEGNVHTYSSNSGKRMLPPIIMGAPISFLESKNQYLMAVTSIAEVYVWDLDKKKIHMKSPSSLAALLDLNSKLQENTLSKSDNITMCSITSKGVPVITLSNGSGYIYNIDMEVWQTVTEAWWAFGSHYWDSITDEKVSAVSDSSRSSGDRDGSSIISMLEHKTNEELLRKSRSGRGKLFNKISKNMMMKEGFENLENTVSLSHLENRILCCEILGEQEDFKDFIITYTNRLCELGLQAKLYEICEGILGETDSPTGKSEKSTICGLDRRNLLKDIILACAEHRDVQRILVHYGNKIGLISRDYE
ncbi:hypothetical protein JCM33374_g64 [Metschnikowia sp. JCM 33374]|nr:hypothetical protein JCM33374_g64 [Metschnikowia sp. JCM 33374]